MQSFINSVPSKILKANREIYKPGTGHMVSCKLYILEQILCVDEMSVGNIVLWKAEPAQGPYDDT